MFQVIRAKHWILLAVIAFSLAFVAVVLSWRNDDSTLSVVTRIVTRYVKMKMGWSDDPLAVLARMAKDEKRGRYDGAISTGVAYVKKYPDSFASGWIYQDISVLYLKRARMDSGHAEEYLKQALLYRDKALRTGSDSPNSLAQLVAISVSIGDLSAAQRCVQYRNSMKLLDRMNLLVNEDKDRLARQFKPDPAAQKKQRVFQTGSTQPSSKWEPNYQPPVVSREPRRDSCYNIAIAPTTRISRFIGSQ